MQSPCKDSYRARVVACEDIGGDGHLLRVRLAAPLRDNLEGGHFFMLRTADPSFPFLSRPFSVHDAHPQANGPELSSPTTRTTSPS